MVETRSQTSSSIQDNQHVPISGERPQANLETSAVPSGDVTHNVNPNLSRFGLSPHRELRGDDVAAKIDSLTIAVETTQSSIVQVADMFKAFMSSFQNGINRDPPFHSANESRATSPSPAVIGDVSDHRNNFAVDENAQYNDMGARPSGNSAYRTPSRQGRPPRGNFQFTRDVLNQYGPDIQVDGDFATPAPLAINQLPAPRFDGDRTKARTWLKEWTNIMSINGYREAEMFRRVSAYFDGEAWTWWVTENKLRPNSDWYSFRRRFLTCFLGGETLGLMSRKLESARQTSDEPPHTYFSRIVELCLEFNPHMPDHEIVNRVANGFLPEIYNSLVLQKKKSDWTLTWLDDNLLELRMAVKSANKEPQAAGTANKGARTPRQRPIVPKDISNWTCFNCNEKGHITEHCQKPKNEANILENKKAYRLKKESMSGDVAKSGTTGIKGA